MARKASVVLEGLKFVSIQMSPSSIGGATAIQAPIDIMLF